MWLLTLCNMFLLLKKDGIISIKYLKKIENVLLKWCLRFFYVMEKDNFYRYYREQLNTISLKKKIKVRIWILQYPFDLFYLDTKFSDMFKNYICPHCAYMYLLKKACEKMHILMWFKRQTKLLTNFIMSMDSRYINWITL